jgi:hypothetical protein
MRKSQQRKRRQPKNLLLKNRRRPSPKRQTKLSVFSALAILPTYTTFSG